MISFLWAFLIFLFHLSLPHADNSVSKTFVLLIQNEGNSSLNVDITIPPSKHMQNTIEIPKLQSKKVEILLPNEGTNTVKLNAGNGDCVLRVGGAPAAQGNFFQKLPSYSKFMTPIYGAYFLLATTLIAASVAACCWFRRKRRPGGDVAYQELEMAAPDSAVAAAESAEGWDQVWDDDWDEEKAVKSPGGRNISANGLTARNAKKDGWEDWDD